MTPAVATVPVVALDGGWTDLGAAEHAALSVLDAMGADGADATVCTHVLRLATENRYGVTIAASGALPAPAAGAFAVRAGPGDVGPLGRLAVDHAERTGGRAIRFPGQDRLRGRMAFADVVGLSAIDALQHTGNPPNAGAALDTRSFVRPVFAYGALVLLTQPGLDGDVMPFEVENPTRCCEFHA